MTSYVADLQRPLLQDFNQSPENTLSDSFPGTLQGHSIVPLNYKDLAGSHSHWSECLYIVAGLLSIIFLTFLIVAAVESAPFVAIVLLASFALFLLPIFVAAAWHGGRAIAYERAAHDEIASKPAV